LPVALLRAARNLDVTIAGSLERPKAAHEPHGTPLRFLVGVGYVEALDLLSTHRKVPPRGFAGNPALIV
jgi:hypothetical protein